MAVSTKHQSPQVSSSPSRVRTPLDNFAALPPHLREDLLRLAEIVAHKRQIHLVVRFEHGKLITAHHSSMKRLYASDDVG